MANAWKVIWFEGGRKLKKTGFPGESPRASGAIDYAKSIIARGISASEVHVVSQRKGFAPTDQMKAKQEPGTAWCPYCVKWRRFHVSALRHDGILGPEAMRCPICTISVNDYYVKVYNQLLAVRWETSTPRLTRSKSSTSRRR